MQLRLRISITYFSKNYFLALKIELKGREIQLESFKALQVVIYNLYNDFDDFSHGIVTKTIFDSLLTRFAPFHLNEFRTYLKASKFSRILDSKRQNSAHYLNLL